MMLSILKNVYTYRRTLPCGRSLEELQERLSQPAAKLEYDAPSVQTDDSGERILILRPRGRVRWYHNSFRPDVALARSGDMLSFRCTLPRLVRRFMGVYSCALLLVQIIILLIAGLSAPVPALLPLLILLFTQLLSIAGLRLTSRRLISELLGDCLGKAG